MVPGLMPERKTLAPNQGMSEVPRGAEFLPRLPVVFPGNILKSIKNSQLRSRISRVFGPGRIFP